MSFLALVIPILITLGVIFLVPCLIVWYWKSRPLWAFFVAALVLFTALMVPVLLQLIYGYEDADPQFSADLIGFALQGGLLAMVLFAPLLWAFQWFILRRHRRKNPKLDADETFS